MQKGFIPIIILVVVFAISVGVGAFYLVNKSQIEKTASPEQKVIDSTQTPSPESEEPSITKTKSPTPTIKKQPTLVPTTKPPSQSTAYCKVVTYADEGSNMSVKFVYGLYNGGSNTMAGAQWDFDGNGSWDTDMSIQNGTKTFNFQSVGTYNARLQLKLSDGSIIGPCSSPVTVPQGIKVGFSGKVFSDTNCNKVWDPNEGYLSGVKVIIVRVPDYTTYRELTSDSEGNFSFTSNINAGENLTINPSAELLPNYSKVYYAPNYTLNSSTLTASGWLSLIPNENVVNCH